MTKRIKGYSLHHGDGTSETHVIKGNIPRASFFPHEGDFKDTEPTEPGALEQIPGLFVIDTYQGRLDSLKVRKEMLDSNIILCRNAKEELLQKFGQQSKSYKPAGMQRDNPYTARLLAIVVVIISAISFYFIVWH